MIKINDEVKVVGIRVGANATTGMISKFPKDGVNGIVLKTEKQKGRRVALIRLYNYNYKYYFNTRDLRIVK